MRITQSMLSNNYMNGLNKSAVNLDKAFRQMSAEKRIFRLSDDPIGMGTSLVARAQLKKMEQYTNNIHDAKSWLDATESSLSIINETIKDAYVRTVNMANGANSQSDREAVASELEQLRDQVVSQLNSQYGERFIFGGYNVGIKPFEYNAGELLYNGINIEDLTEIEIAQEQRLSYEIGMGEIMEVSVTGPDFLLHGGTNLIATFDKTINELRNPSNPSELNVNVFLEAQDEIVREMQQIGGKQNRLDLVLDKYDKDGFNLAGVVSRIEDMSLDEASIEFAKAQSLYQASLAIGAKLMQPSLLDYLR